MSQRSILREGIETLYVTGPNSEKLISDSTLSRNVARRACSPLRARFLDRLLALLVSIVRGPSGPIRIRPGGGGSCRATGISVARPPQ